MKWYKGRWSGKKAWDYSHEKWQWQIANGWENVKIGRLEMEMKRWPVPGLDEKDRKKDDKDEPRHRTWEWAWAKRENPAEKGNLGWMKVSSRMREEGILPIVNTLHHLLKIWKWSDIFSILKGWEMTSISSIYATPTSSESRMKRCYCSLLQLSNNEDTASYSQNAFHSTGKKWNKISKWSNVRTIIFIPVCRFKSWPRTRWGFFMSKLGTNRL